MNQIIFLSLYGLTHQSVFFDWTIVFSANSFGYIMIFLAIMFLIFHTNGVFNYKVPFRHPGKKIKELFYVFSPAVFAWIISDVIKLIIMSPRPFIFYQDVRPLFLHGGLDSFPSGHAIFFSALAMSLYFINKRVGVMYFIVALIVGLARITSGIHFPTDIIVGYILGILIAVIFKFTFKKVNK
jgi:membrane-associated phospholipid phosphatase